LRTRQPLLVVLGEVTAAPADRFGFGDFERADIFVHGIAILEVRAAIAEPPIGPAFIGCGDRSHASADRPAERQDQPPEVRSEVKRALLVKNATAVVRLRPASVRSEPKAFRSCWIAGLSDPRS